VSDAAFFPEVLVPALPSSVIDPIWDQFAALLPEREVAHPLGCHRPRIPDRIVFDKLIQVLVLGAAYNKIADSTCSATTICTVREAASAANTIVRWGSIASRVRANRGLVARSVLLMRKDCSRSKPHCIRRRVGSGVILYQDQLLPPVVIKGSWTV
jgi:transposase